MRIALICLSPKPGREYELQSRKRENTDEYLATATKCANLDTIQTLALAMHMRDGGRFAPIIVCNKNSYLEAQANKIGLPKISVGNSLADMFRIWRWQRAYAHLHILSIGADGLPLARRLIKMRGKNKALLDSCFFLRPPRLEGSAKKSFLMASHCICGSAFIAERISQWLAGLPAKKDNFTPDIVISPPGIELEDYNFPPPLYTQKNQRENQHFVFGMAGSLLPRSGALLVVRAMAALWQRNQLPPWEVRMFGSGPRFREILDEADNLGVSSRLSILSDQPLGDVSRHCHAWLAPGGSPEELPEVLWTGFAARLPIICSQDDLHEERLAITDHNATIQIIGNNPQDMASAMIDVMTEPRLREALAAAAAQARKFTGVDAMADRICSLLESWLPATVSTNEA